MITQLHYKKAFENFLKRHSASWEAKMLVVQWRHHARIHFGYHTDIYRAHFHHTRNEKRPDIMAPDTSAFASSDIGIKNSITEENWRFNQSWFASLVYPKFLATFVISGVREICCPLPWYKICIKEWTSCSSSPFSEEQEHK